MALQELLVDRTLRAYSASRTRVNEGAVVKGGTFSLLVHSKLFGLRIVGYFTLPRDLPHIHDLPKDIKQYLKMVDVPALMAEPLGFEEIKAALLFLPKIVSFERLDRYDFAADLSFACREESTMHTKGWLFQSTRRRGVSEFAAGQTNKVRSLDAWINSYDEVDTRLHLLILLQRCVRHHLPCIHAWDYIRHYLESRGYRNAGERFLSLYMECTVRDYQISKYLEIIREQAPYVVKVTHGEESLGWSHEVRNAKPFVHRLEDASDYLERLVLLSLRQQVEMFELERSAP